MKFFAHPILLSAILWLATFMAPLSVQAQAAFGETNPVIAYNLNDANDRQPGLQFLDLMKLMRPWTVRLQGGAEMKFEELKSAGYLDDEGWFKRLPPNTDFAQSIWVWPKGGIDQRYYTGRYVLTYKGTGRLQVHLGPRVVAESPGRIVFENPEGSTFMLLLKETDPNGTGDYIRDISIVQERHEPLFLAGAVFNPDWLNIIRNSRALRFMDWMKTNNSTITSWNQRPRLNSPNQGIGFSVETMVRLANEVGAEPWFTMPHLANENYIRNFATYVRDHLDPRLKVRVEYSNEVWNRGFEQAKWVNARALSSWGEGSEPDYFVKKAVETALIWDSVFTGSDADRLINVLAVQTVGTFRTEKLLDAAVWRAREPNSFVEPATVFDELAITTYFGGYNISDENLQPELLQRIRQSRARAHDFLADRLMDPELRGSIPWVSNYIKANAEIAAKHGLRLTLYEGGQHVHQWFYEGGFSAEELALFQDFISSFVRSDHMARLYRELWDVWADIGDGPFMQFNEIGAISKYGSWGLYAGLLDQNPRAQAVERLASRSTPWWPAQAGAHFQHGVSLIGTRSANRMVGTVEEDFFAGLVGDDVFVPNGGQDGINGGPGNDRVELAGQYSDYTLTNEGDGVRITGPNTSLYILHVEEILFESGELARFN